MVKIVAVDGPCGSGKTTLLFGRGHEEPLTARHDSLIGRGYQVLPESGLLIAEEMVLEGKELENNLPELMQRILYQEITRYSSINHEEEGVVFLDRGLPGYSEATLLGVPLPDNFYELCEQHRYDSVILLEPVRAFDLSVPRPGEHKIRTFTLEQRMQSYRDKIKAYSDLGYDVIQIPDMPSEKGTTPRVDAIINAMKV